MSGNVLSINATVMCPHGGAVTVLPAQSRVLADRAPVTTVADNYIVTGCPFTIGTKPQPCVTVSWVIPSARVQVHGSPALLQASTGICQSAEGIPQGSPLVTVVQQRVVSQ